MPARVPPPPETLSTESEHLYSLLNEADDFTAIIVGVSYVDACVASLLAKGFVKCNTAEELLDATSGAIGSFATRSKLAYVLGLIGKPMYQDLIALAEMRNEAAHLHFELTFGSPAIIKHSAKLKYIGGLRNGGTPDPLFDAKFLESPRDRFKLTVIMMVNRLIMSAIETSHATRRA